MIEEIIEFGAKLQVQFLVYGNSFGDEGVPLLLKWSARLSHVAAEIAKERSKRSGSSLSSDRESLVAGTTRCVEAGNGGCSVRGAASSRRPKYRCGTQNTWSKRACPCRSLIREVLGRTGLQKVIQVTRDLRKECASAKPENIAGPTSDRIDAHRAEESAG